MTMLIGLAAMLMMLGGCGTDQGVTRTDAAPSAEAAAWTPGVAASADAVRPAPVGATAPSAVLRTVDGEPFDLTHAYHASPTILIFYRGGWCPYCNRHLADLSRVEGQLRAMGYQLLAVTPDQPAELRKTMTKDHLNYTLLSDSDMTLAKAFGLAFALDASTQAKYRGYGINLAAASGGKNTENLLPVPAVYIIDKQGVIRYVQWNADYTTRLPANEVVTAARQSPH
ncbi:MAG: peroxiredoxin-like family protein [Phycisphaeraceae bacterium]